jgi:hypothetical protein
MVHPRILGARRRLPPPAIVVCLCLVGLLGPLAEGCTESHRVAGESPAGWDDGASGQGAADGSANGDGDGDADADPGDGDAGDGDSGDGDGSRPGGDGDVDRGDPTGASCQPCDAVATPFGSFEACCTEAGACGLDLGALSGQFLCVQQNAPGALTEACPGQSIMGLPLTGCCTPAGRCGVLVQTLFPLGCVDVEVLADSFPAGLGAGLPEAGACEP